MPRYGPIASRNEFQHIANFDRTLHFVIENPARAELLTSRMVSNIYRTGRLNTTKRSIGEIQVHELFLIRRCRERKLTQVLINPVIYYNYIPL